VRGDRSQGGTGPEPAGVRRRPIEPPPSRYEIPDPRYARAGDDVVAVGADLAPGTLLTAYRRGLFPMPIEPRRRRSQIAWYSPDPRGIVPLDRFHVSRTLRRSIRRFETSIDQAFDEVVAGCADPSREGFWISAEIRAAYRHLHRLGWAESVEVWSPEGELVGGVYGVRIDGLFAGESMFHRATDASKVALARLVEHLRAGGVTLFDVQWTTPHLVSLGAVDVSRERYLDLLDAALR
jgi:leucyl/phenylalanyl-tRNA--protein transferase